MYLYYCKDDNCQGHTKSWERCCDLRAFAARPRIEPCLPAAERRRAAPSRNAAPYRTSGA
ncbi:hypothetical protein GKC30_04915 [Pseudodesulfovibrio sp. F-1]|uniref:Uncharacterized protein n=1 Tax=Pseudodesulfovibrio alkaliphilus TaxID=2661613 RepID=A0A7K1KM65_9BACT|nr:hypothetical protein [Pseudodesulfovibrio alkaliphilus]MUM76972.1 hypothetical protein [Pseudodesulfovibrio alkaliphilus]